MSTSGFHRAILKMSDIHETEPAVLKERGKSLKSEIARAKEDDDQILDFMMVIDKYTLR